MRKLAFILVGAAAMAVIAAAASFGAGGSAAGPHDAIWGGGHADVFVGGGIEVPRDVSVNVEQGRFGGADGSFVYGRNGLSTIVDAEPTCIAVSGNRAVIGGLSNGEPFVWYAVDNGKPGGAVRDQVSAVLLLGPGDVAQIPGFPNACPSPDTPVGGFEYRDLVGGDLVVRDVS